MSTAAEVQGGRLLREIEHGSLENLLHDLRKLHEKETGIKPPRLGIPGLDRIWEKHGGKLEITGPGGLALLYHIVSNVVSPYRSGTIVVIDADGRFDATRLSCSFEDLKHVHIFRPLEGHVIETFIQAERYLLEGGHASMGREWVGTVVNGGQGGDIMVGWRGWLRVESEREAVPRFGMGISMEEALRERDVRQEAVDDKGWRAVSDWGKYRWINE